MMKFNKVVVMVNNFIMKDTHIDFVLEKFNYLVIMIILLQMM
jgi:hypothetical protein